MRSAASLTVHAEEEVDSIIVDVDATDWEYAWKGSESFPVRQRAACWVHALRLAILRLKLQHLTLVTKASAKSGVDAMTNAALVSTIGDFMWHEFDLYHLYFLQYYWRSEIILSAAIGDLGVHLENFALLWFGDSRKRTS